MGQHGKHRLLVGLALAAGLSCGPAAAACRLALVLGLDVSASVDPSEDALQQQGLAAALRSAPVRRAALAVPGDWVALSVFEWSGRWQQATLLDWTPLTDQAAIERAAARIAGSARGTADFPTAVGYALAHALSRFGAGPDCLSRTLDLSGDGIGNEGFGPAQAYAHFPFDEITVNGLPIAGAAEDVVAFYRDEVLRGPGAFVEIADGFANFERAMRRKLEREMAPAAIGRLE